MRNKVGSYNLGRDGGGCGAGEEGGKTMTRREFIRAAAKVAAAVALGGALPSACARGDGPGGKESPPPEASPGSTEAPQSETETPTPSPEAPVTPEQIKEVLIPPGRALPINDPDGKRILVINNCYHEGSAPPRNLIVNIMALNSVLPAITELPLAETRIYAYESGTKLPDTDISVHPGADVYQAEDNTEVWYVLIGTEHQEPDAVYGPGFCLNYTALYGMKRADSENDWRKDPVNAGQGYPGEMRKIDAGWAFAATVILTFGPDLTYEQYREKLQSRPRMTTFNDQNNPALLSDSDFESMKQKLKAAELPFQITSSPFQQQA